MVGSIAQPHSKASHLSNVMCILQALILQTFGMRMFGNKARQSKKLVQCSGKSVGKWMISEGVYSHLGVTCGSVSSGIRRWNQSLRTNPKAKMVSTPLQYNNHLKIGLHPQKCAHTLLETFLSSSPMEVSVNHCTVHGSLPYCKPSVQ